MQEEWSRKGATLSDKTARKEFGLTQDEIVAAIDAGQLQYRVGVIHGNPWLRLLRREVEDLMDNLGPTMTEHLNVNGRYYFDLNGPPKALRPAEPPDTMARSPRQARPVPE